MDIILVRESCVVPRLRMRLERHRVPAKRAPSYGSKQMEKMMRFHAGIAALAAGMLMAGCGTTGSGHPGSTAQLVGVEWVVEDIAGRGLIDDSRVTLLFAADGRLSGRASCNRLMATYVAESAKLRIRDSGLTRMACPPALMDQERRLVEVLNAVDSYRIDNTGALVLSTQSGATVTARPGVGQ